MLADAFASIALGFSQAMGGPYHPGKVVRQGEPVRDDGGSIVTPAAVTRIDVSVQVDSATEAMRGESGFSDKDMRLLVLGDVDLTTDDVIAVLAGEHAGRWSVQSCERDAAGIGWSVRGRRG